MTLNKVLFQVENNVAYITMNRPESLNILDESMQKELMQCFAACEFDRDIKAVVYQAEGKSFSGGGDIKGMVEELAKTPKNNPLLDEGFAWPGIISRQVRNLKKPVICAMQGAVAGAAANIALMCDFRIAATDMILLEAFVKIGLVTDGGGIYILNKLLGPARTTDLVMSGRAVKADEAFNLGLVNEIVPPENLRERSKSFAETFTKGPTRTYRHMKSLINQAAFSDLAGYLELEADIQRVCGDSEDFLEGVKAFVEKRKPRFTGN